MNQDFDPTIGKATRWQKGQPSPNPAGRPKQTKLTAAFREVLAEPFPGGRGLTYAQVIARRVASDAAKGNLMAVKEIADRTEGKVRAESELRGRGDQALSSLEIRDQATAHEQLTAVLARLRERFAREESNATAQTPDSGN
jgi:Family of unknown function (DUF5681)